MDTVFCIGLGLLTFFAGCFGAYVNGLYILQMKNAVKLEATVVDYKKKLERDIQYAGKIYTVHYRPVYKIVLNGEERFIDDEEYSCIKPEKGDKKTIYYWKKPDSFCTKFNVIIDFIFGLLLILSSVFIFSII